jgi:hypothetical protein
MIFPDVSKETWMKRYPSIKPIEVECLNCHNSILVDKPFITRDYVGFSVSKCPKCNVSHKAYTATPCSQDELNEFVIPLSRILMGPNE